MHEKSNLKPKKQILHNIFFWSENIVPNADKMKTYRKKQKWHCNWISIYIFKYIV